MTTKHTSGPWLHDQPENMVLAQQSNGTHFLVAQARSLDVSKETRDANARLIAAAPDLLAALIALDECYCAAGPHLTKEERHQHRMTLIAARAAVSKATGAA